MKVDQFESVFRAAAKEPYRFQRVDFQSILVATDLLDDAAASFSRDARTLLRVLGNQPQWSVLGNAEFDGVESLLQRVNEIRPDLIVTYRNLRSNAWRWPYTLGEHLDVLTQIAPAPVLVTPHPEASQGSSHSMQNTDSVMAMTDHLAGDHRLVNVAARLTAPNGDLLLAHVEDEHTFDRYMEVISKIDFIETDPARDAIRNQLLKEPADYIESCAQSLRENAVAISVHAHVAMGSHLREYRRLVAEHQIDLLVMNTKDHDQLALGAWLFGIRRLRTPAEREEAAQLVSGFDENDGIKSDAFFWFGAFMLAAFIGVIPTAYVLIFLR